MTRLYNVILFNLHAQYIMQNARLGEAQDGIKIARRNINNLRYGDDTTLMAESEEELRSLLMRMKEETEKAGLKLNIKKNKIMASSPITSWQTEGKKVEAETDFIFLGSKITAVTIAMKLKDTCFLEESFDKPRQHIKKHQFFSASFLYSPTLKSIHEYWKNHSLDCSDLCQQSEVSAF